MNGFQESQTGCRKDWKVLVFVFSWDLLTIEKYLMYILYYVSVHIQQ